MLQGSWLLLKALWTPSSVRKYCEIGLFHFCKPLIKRFNTPLHDTIQNWLRLLWEKIKWTSMFSVEIHQISIQYVNLWNKLLFSALVQVHYFPRRWNSKYEYRYQTIVELMPTLHQEDIHLLKEDIPHTK